MLRRLGNKKRLLPKLLPLFPEKIVTFIDMFLGSGAVTFAMVDRCKYIIANDNDNDVYNLFMMLKERKEELLDAVTTMPIHESLFKHWKTTEEQDPIWQAARFLMLSNFSCWGAGNTIFFACRDNKKCLKNGIQGLFEKIQKVQFTHCDFRDFFLKFFDGIFDPKDTFIYADPPYLDTGDNYKNGFTEEDTQDLFSILLGSGLRFAVSEFPHPYILSLANKHGLHVTSLGERRNLKNRCEEILITNYEPVNQQQELF